MTSCFSVICGGVTKSPDLVSHVNAVSANKGRALVMSAFMLACLLPVICLPFDQYDHPLKPKFLTS